MSDSRPIPDERGVFCNRTLNMRTIRAIGYDMDYTLIHYNVDEWEGRAYAYVREKLQTIGWPVEELEFDARVIRLERAVIENELEYPVAAQCFAGRLLHQASSVPEIQACVGRRLRCPASPESR